jgi:eukaryotic-like serine/threonine-protein kinase
MQLTAEQWERVKALFEAALEKPAVDRTSFLGQSREEPAVLQEVERLLASHGEAGDFLSPPLPPRVDSPVALPSLSPGVLLSDRFRIVRFLARGGMGEVYEAEDMELHARVAVKTIRPELLEDDRILERFKREVHLAKQVTHPNVCRIFDLFRHPVSRVGGGGHRSLVFVVMELLEGETLGERLGRGRRMSASQAFPIALQMASALGAAHDAGVLHRDFKPGNVVLAPANKGTRAVVTDFGLALRAATDTGAATMLTEPGQWFGTPAYLSPEQVESKPLTPASDVYCLGLVFYEMATGTQPFADATPLAMAVKRLQADPVRPRELVPDLDRHWEQIILRCLRREPHRRFQNGDEVARALRDEIRGSRRGRTAAGWLAGIAAAVIVVAAIRWLAPAIRQRAMPSATVAERSIKMRPSLAVLPLRNLSGRSETGWVSTALPEMLTTELAVGEKLRTVPGETIARAAADLALSGKDTLASDTLQRLRQYLGSDYVVLGSYLDLGQTSEGLIRVDLRLQDTKSGEILANVSEKGSERALDELATRAGADLRARLGLQAETPEEVTLARASLSSTPEAVRLYSQGLARFRLLDARAATGLLLRAIALDPSFALAHSALADAWSLQGYDEKAQAESKRALDLAAGLPRESRLWIEGRYWALNHTWNKAVEIYRTLFDFFPDNLDYGLHLVDAQQRARTVDEALATLAQLRRLPPPAGNDPRIDLEQADVFDVKGAYQDQQAAATAAGDRAQTIGAQWLLIGALNRIARSLEKQGKLDEAAATAEEASKLASAAGERAEVAQALTILGIVRFDQSNFSAAREAYQQALALQRETGNKRGEATTLNDLGNVLGAQGDLAGTIQMFEGSLGSFREIGDKHSAAAVLGNIGTWAFRLGDLQGAKQTFEQALTASREIGDQERTATAIYNLGETLRMQGELTAASHMYQQALDRSKSTGDLSGTAYAIAGLGDVLTLRGELAAAQAKYEEALGIRKQIGENGTIAETQLAEANLSLEANRLGEAESLVRQVHAEFHKEGNTDDELLALMLLARVLVASGKPAAAEQQMAAARPAIAKSQDFSVRLKSMIVNAEVVARSGKPEDGLRGLEAAIGQAQRRGYLGLRLEAQISLGQMQFAVGQASSAKATLGKARSSAQAAGYGLLVSKVDRIVAQESLLRRPRKTAAAPAEQRPLRLRAQYFSFRAALSLWPKSRPKRCLILPWFDAGSFRACAFFTTSATASLATVFASPASPARSGRKIGSSVVPSTLKGISFGRTRDPMRITRWLAM